MLNTTTAARKRPMIGDGRPRLASIVALDGWDESALLSLAASLARGLATPAAAAILESARERELPIQQVDRFDPPTLLGVGAVLSGHAVVLGNDSLCTELELSLETLGEWPERLRQRGEHVLFVAVDRRTVGFLSVIGVNEQTHTTNTEDEMRDSQMTTDYFPTDVANLPAAKPPEFVTLADRDQFDLRIAPVRKRVGDEIVRMVSYNGSIPGPTLRVPQGSQILVNVVNEGDLEATVHWHGLRLENRYDGTLATQRSVPVGGTFAYRLTFPDPGVYWYHPHIREDYGQEMGLYGNIVVVPSEPDYWPPAHRELTLALDDILIEDGNVAPFSRLNPTYTAMGRFGNVLLLNGEPHLSLRARLGEIVRCYMTNTANTRVFNIGFRGARMKLVGGDSGRYERETFVEDVVIAPSERVVIDVLFDRPGPVTVEHRTPTRTYPLADIGVGNDSVEQRLTAQFDVLRTNSDLTAERTRIENYLAAEPDKTLALVAEMDMGEPQLPADAAIAYICPMHADVISDQPDRCPKCGMKLIATDAARIASTSPMRPDDGESHTEHSHQPDGIEWEDDMVAVNRATDPTNMRWKLIDRRTGADGEAIDWRFRVGDQVKIRIINEMDSDHPMHHPFHIHGAGRFLIMSRDGVTEPNLAWKDTVLIPTGQTVDILLGVTNPGMWMAHCHIAEHHESGMMLRFGIDE